MRRQLLLGVVLLAVSSLFAAGMEQSLRDGARMVSGSGIFHQQVTIAGQLFDLSFHLLDRFCTFDVRGWDVFTVGIGISDDAPATTTGTIVIEMDGHQVWSKVCRYGERATLLTLQLHGAKTLTFRCLNTNGNDADRMVAGDPLLTKGRCAVSQESQLCGVMSLLVDLYQVAEHDNNTALSAYLAQQLTPLGLGIWQYQ